MTRRFSRLPPVTSLVVFEAAGRHLNFSEAARELSMTQPAVSQQIAMLETDLGVALFQRQHRGVALTVQGAQLLAAVEKGLAAIEDAALSMRRQTGRKILQVLTDFGFAAWWLVPRLGNLGKILTDVEVRILATQSEVDFRREEADVAILFGSGRWPSSRVTALFPERVYPVGSREVLAGSEVPLDPTDIARMRLLHLQSSGTPRWFTWKDWFSAFGIRRNVRSQDLTFNNYQMVLQAVLLGQGVALGWAPFVDDFVQTGELERLTDVPLESDRGYFIVEPPARFPDPTVAQFREWVLRERDGAPSEVRSRRVRQK